MPAQQKTVQRVNEVLGGHCAGRQGDVKFVANRAQQLICRELGIEDVGHIAVGWYLLQKAAAHGCFAGTNLAAEQYKPTAAAQAVQQMRQRLAVPFAHEQVTRVWCDGKRVLAKTEIFGVHG